MRCVRQQVRAGWGRPEESGGGVRRARAARLEPDRRKTSLRDTAADRNPAQQSGAHNRQIVSQNRQQTCPARCDIRGEASVTRTCTLPALTDSIPERKRAELAGEVTSRVPFVSPGHESASLGSAALTSSSSRIRNSDWSLGPGRQKNSTKETEETEGLGRGRRPGGWRSHWPTRTRRG